MQIKLPWQVRTTLLVGIVGPPVASLILLTITYLPLLERLTAPVDVSSFVELYILFAVPVGYCFGVFPALLAGAIYCGALTAMATLRSGILPRACLAAISGGLVGGVWFHAVIGPDSQGYGSVAAFVLALISLRWPRVDKVASPDASLQLRALFSRLAGRTSSWARSSRVAREQGPYHPTPSRFNEEARNFSWGLPGADRNPTGAPQCRPRRDWAAAPGSDAGQYDDHREKRAG
jgi:hypothetical protein